MVNMVNFMFCAFYHDGKKKEGNKGKKKEKRKRKKRGKRRQPYEYGRCTGTIREAFSYQSLKESYDQLSILKSRDYFANKSLDSQGYGFSSGHVRMWELDYKESWAPNNWCFWTKVLEKTLESPLDSKEIQPVHPKEGKSWGFIGRNGCWRWNSNTLATSCKELTRLKRPWCWERLKAGGEGDDRGWDGWMASPTQWTWVWVNSRSWW